MKGSILGISILLLTCFTYSQEKTFDNCNYRLRAVTLNELMNKAGYKFNPVISIAEKIKYTTDLLLNKLLVIIKIKIGEVL